MAQEGEPSPRWLAALTRVGRFLVGLPRPVGLLLGISWIVMIWALSSSSFPPPRAAPSFVWALTANLAHAPLFGLLTLLWVGALLPRSRDVLPAPRSAVLAASFGIALVYGAVDEWHQSWTPGRNPSALDVLTDATGSLCVLWVVAALTDPAVPAGDRPGLVLSRLRLGLVACVGVAVLGTLLD